MVHAAFIICIVLVIAMVPRQVVLGHRLHRLHQLGVEANHIVPYLQHQRRVTTRYPATPDGYPWRRPELKQYFTYWGNEWHGSGVWGRVPLSGELSFSVSPRRRDMWFEWSSGRGWSTPRDW